MIPAPGEYETLLPISASLRRTKLSFQSQLAKGIRSSPSNLCYPKAYEALLPISASQRRVRSAASSLCYPNEYEALLPVSAIQRLTKRCFQFLLSKASLTYYETRDCLCMRLNITLFILFTMTQSHIQRVVG